MKKVLLMLALSLLAVQGVSQANKPLEQGNLPAEPTYQRLSAVAVEEADPWAPMSAPVNALVMAMVERDVVYDVHDSEFLWNSLYYMIGIHYSMDFRVTDLGEKILVPEEMVLDVAFALFGDDVVLTDVPLTLAKFVSKEGSDYTMVKGDAAPVTCVLQHSTDLGQGRFLLEGDFVSEPDDMAVISHFEAIVVVDAGMFGYSMEEINLIAPVG